VLDGAKPRTKDGWVTGHRSKAPLRTRRNADGRLGLVSLQQNRWPEARAELGKACDLDEVGDTWWRVASWYQQANDSKALAELRERYRARFGRELRAAR
jgi:hypothetical protein